MTKSFTILKIYISDKYSYINLILHEYNNITVILEKKYNNIEYTFVNLLKEILIDTNIETLPDTVFIKIIKNGSHWKITESIVSNIMNTKIVIQNT